MQELLGLTFEDFGRGEVPLICLHGIGGNTESFRPQLDELAKYTRVIALNLPGYGGSRPISPVTFEMLSNRLHDFLDAAGIQRAVLLGQSIGGMVAIDFAARFPARVDKLILVGTTSAFGGRDESFKDAFLEARLAPLDAGKTMAELANEFVPEIVGPIASPATIANAVKSMSQVPLDTYRAIIECLVTFNRRTEIGSISQPACLIAGEHDRNAPAKTMEKMAQKMPDAAFHQIEGAGHLVNLEAGDATNAIVKKFLNFGG